MKVKMHVQYFNISGHIIKTCSFFSEIGFHINDLNAQKVELLLILLLFIKIVGSKIWKLSQIRICSWLLILLNTQIATSFLQAKPVQAKLRSCVT